MKLRLDIYCSNLAIDEDGLPEVSFDANKMEVELYESGM